MKTIIRSFFGICACLAVLVPLSSVVNIGAKQETNPLAEILSAPDRLPPLPVVDYPADKPEILRKAYTFAALHPEVIKYVPCYCLCSKSLGHRSSEDCFIRSRGRNPAAIVWSRHAAECSICLSVALEAARLLEAGKSPRAIHDAIDAAFRSKFKNRTDTPSPPDPITLLIKHILMPPSISGLSS